MERADWKPDREFQSLIREVPLRQRWDGSNMVGTLTFQSLNREVLLGLVVEDITPDEEEKFQSLIREVLLRLYCPARPCSTVFLACEL